MKDMQKHIEVTVKQPEPKPESLQAMHETVPNGFIYITKALRFKESVGSYALVEAVFMELGKASINGNLYLFSEGESIRKSMIGKPVFYDVNRLGKHKDIDYFKTGSLKNSIGTIQSARIVGKQIIGVIKVTKRRIVNMLRKGRKFMFSIAGMGLAKRFLSGAKEAFEIIGAKIQSLQMIPTDKLNIFGLPQRIGFPEAKMTKLLRVQESVLTVNKSLLLLAGADIA